MQSRPRLGVPVVLLLITTAVWCVALPLLWAHNLQTYVSSSYLERLSLYLPELMVATIVITSLVLLAFKSRLSVIGFAAAALAAPILKVAIGSPSGGVWPVSLALLALVACRLHALFKPEA